LRNSISTNPALSKTKRYDFSVSFINGPLAAFVTELYIQSAITKVPLAFKHAWICLNKGALSLTWFKTPLL